MKQSSLTRAIGVVFGLLVSLLPTTSAPADHETIIVDGDLTDLINAVNNNLGSANGGFDVDDVTEEIGTIKCPYYVNGYDIDRGLVFIDFRNPDGSFADHSTLYVGFDVTGVVGDVDGNGAADSFDPNASCAISDGPAGVDVGPGESYSMQVDLDCDGFFDLRIGVNNDQLGRLGAGGEFQSALPGAFAISDGFLEFRIDDFDQVVRDAGGDPCDARMFLFANASDDLLGEDRSPMFQLAVPPSVAITKSPSAPDACPGTEVTWTIRVTNDGMCLLNTISMTDTIGVGHTFVSSNPSSSGDDHIRSFTFTDLAAGDFQEITLVTRLSEQCAAPVLENSATVVGTYIRPEGCGGSLATPARAVATVGCSQPPCAITPADTTICEGTTATLCGFTDAGLSYEWTLPDGSTRTTRCITSGQVGIYTLEVTDKTGCANTCQAIVRVRPLPPCSIAPVDTTICAGTTATLCGPAGAGLTYEWTLPDGSTRTTRCITSGLAGTYTLEVTDNIGCTNTCEAIVRVRPQPPCSITPSDTTICAGTTATLCGPAGAGLTYEWTLPDGSTQTTRCITSGLAGTYTLEVTDNIGCANSCEAIVRVRPQPPCSITPADTTICEGTTASLCGPAGGGLSYEWTLPDGSTQTTRCISAGLAGTYDLEVTDDIGCLSRCSAVLEVGPCQGNCPRTPGFWTQQCAQRGNGSTKFTPAEMQQITFCVDNERSTFFNWPDGQEFAGFCPVIDPPRPMNVRKQAKRQFAAFLANVCTGELGLLPSNGAPIMIDLDTPIDCAGLTSNTLGELIAEVDGLLAMLEPLSLDDPAVRASYGNIISCVDAINNGVGIPLDPICAENSADRDRGELSSRPDSHDPEGAKAGGPNALATLRPYRPTPNPFAKNTYIAYAVRDGGGEPVDIRVFDVAGRLVRKLVNRTASPGLHAAIWDGRNDKGEQVTRGMYYVRGIVGSERFESRVLYLR